MQVLTLNANQWVYTVYDTAPVPFGDPFNDCSATSASPAVFSAVGYQATSGDSVTLSVDSGGYLDTGFVVGTIYYVVAPSTQPTNPPTFELSATKGGSAINAASTTASTLLTVHLVSEQVDGTVIPFKPGNTVVAMNVGSQSCALYGAPDASAPVPGTYTAPQGPGTAVLIATVASGTAKLVQLGYDWLKNSTTSVALILIQN
jgi:hypothetical protein